MGSSKLRIAWFSPLAADVEPSTSIAQYATEVLLPKIERTCDVELFHDSLGSYRGRAVHPHLNAWKVHEERPFDVFFYQLEDDKRAYFSRIHSALVPGVTWFHHFFLSDYGPEPILNSAWRKTLERFHDKERPWADRDAKHEPLGPQAFREAAVAGIKMFSNERDHREYRRIVQTSVLPVEDRSYYLPLPVDFSSCRVSDASGPFTVAFAGSARIEHRAHTLLDAIARMDAKPHLAWMVPERDEEIARAMLEDFGTTNVRLVAGSSPSLWSEIVASASVAIHTTFSVFGQLGPYLNISSAHGVPSIVCNFGQGELLPDSLFFKVFYGKNGPFELAALLSELMRHGNSELPARIRAYAEETFDADVIAVELLSVLSQSKPKLTELMSRWKSFEADARQSLLEEAGSFIEPLSPGLSAFANAFGELGWSAESRGEGQ